MSTATATALHWLQQAAARQPAVFSTSFGAEDMVLLDLIRRHGLPIGIFTLDTGRLPEETYRLMQQVEARYGRCVEVHFPDAQAVQRLVAAIGVNGFYESVEQRRACCAVRKTEPLARALAGKRAWVTGLRALQSVTRVQLPAHERETGFGVEKFNPLHDWSEADVWRYLRQHEVPYNELHDRFYPSIGCAPCTRAIAAGEDIRAGRWWWENADTKECGLHRKPQPVGVSSPAAGREANVKADAEAAAGRRRDSAADESGRHAGGTQAVGTRECA